MVIKLEHPRPWSGSSGGRPARLTGLTRRRALLACGVIGPAWWVAMDIVGSLRYSRYSYVDQTISELSAEGAPTRTFMMVASGIPYAALMTAFGIGIWKSVGGRRAGRVTAAMVLGETVWGSVGGLLFPMAIRGNEESLRNSLHAPYGIAMPIFFLLAVGFGTRLLGRRFRYFSYAIVLTILIFGVLTAMQMNRVPANEATPWLGIEERVSGYAPMLWFAVLAIGLLRAEGTDTVQSREDLPA